jgi:ATP-binding cassette subfamily B protein
METKQASTIIKQTPQPSTAIRLMGHLWQQHVRLTIVGLSVICYIVLSIWAPFRSAQVIDLLWQTIKFSRAHHVAFELVWNPLGKALTYLSIHYFFLWLFYYLQSYLMADVAENLVLSLRKQVSAKLNKLPLRFFDQNKSGEVLSRVTNDLDKVSETLQTGLLKLVVAIGTVIGSLGVMFYYNVLLTGIFLVFMGLSVVITKIVARKNLEYATKRQATLGELTGVVEEYYTGRNIIKSFTQEKSSMARVERANEANRQASQKADFLTNCVNPLIRLLTRIAHVIIAIIAGLAMMQGTMSIGVVQAFFQYINQTAEPLTQASYMINTLQAALASAQRIYSLIDHPEEVPDTQQAVSLPRAQGAVAFDQVDFGYAPAELLMKHISFQACVGEKVAIVGSTGAGKTTLINLLMRFYEINGGKITVDGIATTDLTRAELRHNFGMVLQETWLFNGTIAENIAYGKPEATRKEIVAAAKAAKIDYFIRTMPQNYDTVLENDGANLSVGQRQLLTIARVFLCDPPILILDEATSSVDTRTETEINHAMQKLMHGRTSFVIAHRLSTIRDADTILFMEKGTIIEQGNHDELMQANGAYAKLYNSQFV